jgi:hypothetical protein
MHSVMELTSCTIHKLNINLDILLNYVVYLYFLVRIVYVFYYIICCYWIACCIAFLTVIGHKHLRRDHGTEKLVRNGGHVFEDGQGGKARHDDFPTTHHFVAFDRTGGFKEKLLVLTGANQKAARNARQWINGSIQVGGGFQDATQVQESHRKGLLRRTVEFALAQVALIGFTPHEIGLEHEIVALHHGAAFNPGVDADRVLAIDVMAAMPSQGPSTVETVLYSLSGVFL